MGTTLHVYPYRRDDLPGYLGSNRLENIGVDEYCAACTAYNRTLFIPSILHYILVDPGRHSNARDKQKYFERFCLEL